MGFLIDTCIWVDVERGTLAPADVASFTRKEAVYISPVTIAELKFGAEKTSDKNLRQKRLSALRHLIQKPLLKIDGATGEIFGNISAALATTGRGHGFRIQDTWLAAQAIQHNFRLLTYNAKDFRDIPGLELVVMPTPVSQ